MLHLRMGWTQFSQAALFFGGWLFLLWGWYLVGVRVVTMDSSVSHIIKSGVADIQVVTGTQFVLVAIGLFLLREKRRPLFPALQEKADSVRAAAKK